MKFAIGGKMGSGKDTIADYLCKKYGGVKIASSSGIYDIQHYAQDICGFQREKDRYFLQTIGEWARQKDPDVWIRSSIIKANKLLRDANSVKNVIISDIRYPNEFFLTKSNGWILIRVDRRDRNLQSRLGTGILDHPSETEIDKISWKDWDYTLDNNGTLQDLYEKIDEIVKIESSR